MGQLNSTFSEHGLRIQERNDGRFHKTSSADVVLKRRTNESVKKDQTLEAV